MKVCVTSVGNDLESAVDPKFGRCAFFLIVDTETLQFKAISNPNVSVAGGAGIQSAQLVANEEAKAVVTGNVGPNAFQTLSSFGLKVYAGAKGKIKEVVQQYKEGEFKEMSGPSVPGHFGTGGNK